uniref:Multiple coagulation factor deficiency protein 2 n=1 Tax=Parastrongyloides trichosuri TaxID=131310 RepID=A0A0N4ZT93_PARTI
MYLSWIGSFLLLTFIKSIICHSNQLPGQNPPLQGHHAGGHGQNHQNMEQFGGQAAHDAEHIKEHLDGKIDPTANMTPEQLQFHYFNMHDLDKNGKLDGIELIKAITHFHQENPGPQHKEQGVPPPLPSEMELEQMIDSILNEDDFNGDGFIDYGEFLKAQQQRDQIHRNANPPK